MLGEALCIIAQEKSDSNLQLLEEAKKQFESVFFTTLDGINIGFDKEFSINYKSSELLKYNMFLTRIPKKYYSYAYQLLSLLPQKAYLPIHPIAYLLAEERFFLLTILRKREIPTLNMHMARSSSAALRSLETMNLPIMIRIPDKTVGMIAEGRGEAKSVIEALESINQPILIEDMTNDVTSVYVSELDAIASVKKKTSDRDVVFGKGELRKTKISSDIEVLALDTIKSLDSRMGRVDISLKPTPRVVNVELNPDLIAPSKATGINIPEKIISSIVENYEKHLEKPLLMKFFQDAKTVARDVLKSKSLL